MNSLPTALSIAWGRLLIGRVGPAQFPVETEAVPGDQTYTAHATRTRVLAAGGGATAAGAVSADATVKLDFSSSAGFVLDYEAAELSRYRSVGAVQDWLLALARNGTWDPGRALVTEVISAHSATLVMSIDSSSSVSLTAKASVPTGVPGISLADPTLGWESTTSQGNALVSLCAASTPLYHCVRIRKDWLGRYHANLLATETGGHQEAFSSEPFDVDADV